MRIWKSSLLLKGKGARISKSATVFTSRIAIENTSDNESCCLPWILRPFTTDACSLFPDGNLKDPTLCQDCCIEHDIAYWQGGTEEDKKRADVALRDCIEEKTGDSALAQHVYEGVRVGGLPVFPSWYRWG